MSDDVKWQNRAACRSMDPAEMQPEVASDEQVADAKGVCEFCPVFDQCRQAALDQGGEAYGVWAGMWWGPPPKVPAVRCQWCEEEIDLGERPKGGRPRQFCGVNCKNAASRARKLAAAAAA